MSAYGPIARAAAVAPPPPTRWPVRAGALTVHHLPLADARAHAGLLPHLHTVFADEVARGATYPQEDVPDAAAFEAYFFAADAFVAVFEAAGEGAEDGVVDADGGREVATAFADAAGGRPWEACIAGFFYVKPNYPGRSSHICNAGFVVPPAHRARGVGRALARAFVRVAPALGYRGSVFNLVYANNAASLRLWDALGFTRVGTIPRAGRLRTPSGEEEYVDAWVVYRSFECAEEKERTEAIV